MGEQKRRHDAGGEPSEGEKEMAKNVIRQIFAIMRPVPVGLRVGIAGAIFRMAFIEFIKPEARLGAFDGSVEKHREEIVKSIAKVAPDA